jgi:tripartite-type tricarboxylate transporter receptor subunit TctC
MRISRLSSAVFVASALFAAGCASALAQTWPSKPIKIIVPFPAGGSVDSMGRVLAARLQEQLKTSVIIDNRGGAGGNVGAALVAKSTPDGYTFLLNTNGQAISPSIYKSLPYDSDKDLVRVSALTGTSTVIVINPKLPAKNFQEFVALAKSKPGAMNYGSTGVGNALHLTMELVMIETGINLQMVPFTGDAPLFNSLIAGEIQAALVPTTTARGHVESGSLRAIAMTTAKRVESWPDTPTIAEQGLPNFAVSGWLGLFAPAGTPREIVDAVALESKLAMKTPEMQKALAALTLDPLGSTPDEFEAIYNSDRAKFQKIIKDAKIPLQD